VAAEFSLVACSLATLSQAGRGDVVSPQIDSTDAEPVGASPLSLRLPDMPSDVSLVPIYSRPPTSVVLQRLVSDAPSDFVTPAWVLQAVHDRAFGFLILLLGLVAVVPSLSTAALLVVVPAMQMIVARRAPTLPRWIANRPMATPRLTGLVTRLVPVLRRMETVVRPRWRASSALTQRVVGGVILLLGLSILCPMPLSSIPPGLAIMLLAFGYLEEDGLLLAVGLVGSAISLAFTAGTVWGAVAGMAAL